jgi:integrase
MLTDKAIFAARARDKLYRLSDGRVPNLCLEIPPNGSKRWRLRYFVDGKEKMLSLGVYPAVSLEEARNKAIDIRRALSEGKAPGFGRTAVHPTTFQDAAQEWWNKFKATHNEKYSNEIWRRLERNIFPFFGSKALSDITPPMVLTVLRRIEARGTVETAHKYKSFVSQIFRYGIACGYTHSNPARDLAGALTPRKKKPRPAIIDPLQAGRLMLAIDGYPYPFVRNALLLQALTFVRPGELRRAKWEEIDMDAAEWRIPAEKMKMKRPHLVPLSRQSLAVLDYLKSIRGNSDYIFPSVRSAAQPMSDNTINAALRLIGYDKETMCGHGFRAMANSLLAERGWSVDAIERQLAHVEGNTVRAAYHRSSHLDERRRMMQGWADYLDELRVKARNYQF